MEFDNTCSEDNCSPVLFSNEYVEEPKEKMKRKFSYSKSSLVSRLKKDDKKIPLKDFLTVKEASEYENVVSSALLDGIHESCSRYSSKHLSTALLEFEESSLLTLGILAKEFVLDSLKWIDSEPIEYEEGALDGESNSEV